MASTALDFLVSKLSETLFNIAKEELARQIGLIDNVEKIQGTLEELQCYLQDAENKSIQDTSTNRWLQQIKDVVYDIEDILDEYVLEVDEIISNKKASTSSAKPGLYCKVCCNSPILACFKKAASKHRISIQIQDLNNKLTEIMNQIPRLELIRSIYSSSSSQDPILANQEVHRQLSASVHMMHPIVIRSDIVGRRVHDDAMRLVESLTKEDDRDNPLVYAIVGIGGIGKTTLAKLIFDDNIIINHFDVKLWASVSQKYNKINVLKNIIESASGKEERGQNLGLLCEKFKGMVDGKRLLMVLDDVWEAENIWNNFFKSLLKSGAARGSRVLLTTRNIEVAEQMMAIHIHSVESLPLEDGWLLLRKAVFPPWEQHEAGDYAWGLKDVGIEFVKKCNGLPLAINAIGGILSAERRTRDAWASVLKNSLWELKGLPSDIHTALYMSYQYLPSNIKQCFLYFSLIPKGVFLRSITASEHWLQEGFIKEESNLSVYDVGESYLRLLFQRNLLMHVSFSPEESDFYMHDIVHSLAQFLVQNENRLVTNDELLRSKSSSRQMKLRRLSYMGGGGKTTEVLPRCLAEHVALRTLLVFDQSISRIDNDLFNHLRRLRSLSFFGTSLKELPSSVGALKNLRYLNLASTLITELPTAIGNLKNLRVLIVARCINLFNLPSCIKNFHRLRTLVTYESGLIHLPPELRELHELQSLDFILPLENIGREFSSLEALGELKQLRILTLLKLERAMDPSKARSADIKGKCQLEILLLFCSKNEFNAQLYSPEAEEFSDRLKEVFEELCPPPQLRKLHIIDYFGRQLPSWLSPSPSNLLHANLRCITLMGCSNFNKLPGLGLLPNLEKLEIGWASSLKRIDPEFYTGNAYSNDTENVFAELTHQKKLSKFAFSGPFFPRLKLLHIINMDNLEEWASPGEGISTMPRIETLIIRDCPNLKSLPEDLLCDATSLKKVIIEGAEKLYLKAVHNDPSLELLILFWIGRLERISGLPSLQMLSALSCPELNVVDIKHSLERLLWGDFITEKLPGWLATGNLRASFLEIRCNERLLRKICSKDGEGGNEFTKIQHYDNISAWDKIGLLRLTYTKNPYSFTVHPSKRSANLVPIGNKYTRNALTAKYYSQQLQNKRYYSSGHLFQATRESSEL